MAATVGQGDHDRFTLAADARSASVFDLSLERDRGLTTEPAPPNPNATHTDCTIAIAAAPPDTAYADCAISMADAAYTNSGP